MRTETLNEVGFLITMLANVANMVRADTDDVIASGNHVEVITHYNHLRNVTASIKEAREAIAQIEEHMSREVVPSFMAKENVKTITLVGIGRVTVSHRYSCSMLDKAAGIAWLKANNHGDIVQETVNSSTLAAFSKSLLEDAGKELPEEIFKVGTSPFTSITKVK